MVGGTGEAITFAVALFTMLVALAHFSGIMRPGAALFQVPGEHQEARKMAEWLDAKTIFLLLVALNVYAAIHGEIFARRRAAAGEGPAPVGVPDVQVPTALQSRLKEHGESDTRAL